MTEDDGVERCPHCRRPVDDQQALDEILLAMRADGAERTQRLTARIEEDEKKRERGFE